MQYVMVKLYVMGNFMEHIERQVFTAATAMPCFLLSTRLLEIQDMVDYAKKIALALESTAYIQYPVCH